MINQPVDSNNNLGVHRIYLVGGRIDEVQPWHGTCLDGHGPFVTLTGYGRQQVRFVNDSGNYQTADVDGQVHLEVLDDLVNGKDTIDVYFTPNAEERWASKTEAGPFRAELGGNGVIIVLGK